MRTSKRDYASFLRNAIFGVEDSLVSTVGLLSGIAIADVPRQTILLTGVVLIFVEAFSMAAGAFVSESSAARYLAQRETGDRPSVMLGFVMFVSYFVSGFIPLFPYLLLPSSDAFTTSIALSLLALLGLGAWGGRAANINVARSALRMALIGGLAITVGILAGRGAQFFT